MIKNLIKLANHLDKKKLIKEADLLDQIIKLAAENLELFEEYDGPIELIENINYNKLILEKSNKEIKDIFIRACQELINKSEKILGPKIKYNLDLLDPRYDSSTSKDIEKIFGEEKLNLLSRIELEYDPVSILEAINYILDDKSGYFGLKKYKNKVKSLLSSLNNIMDKVFY